MIHGICGRCHGPSPEGPICLECRHAGQERLREYQAAVARESVQTVRELIAEMRATLEKSPDITAVEVEGSEIRYQMIELDDQEEWDAMHHRVSQLVSGIRSKYAFSDAITVLAS